MGKDAMTIPSDSVLVMKSASHRHSPEVGQGWQPEVAQFLLDIYPDALEQGLGLSDLYQMVTMPLAGDQFVKMESFLEDAIGQEDEDE